MCNALTLAMIAFSIYETGFLAAPLTIAMVATHFVVQIPQWFSHSMTVRGGEFGLHLRTHPSLLNFWRNGGPNGLTFQSKL